ncbi:MAG TPA: hypothetical protein VMN60_02010 [Longimicrobiales bacterium]|nr:hypothetical protein [Longimicrobiales bacterium]
MKIKKVRANNRRKAFELEVADRQLDFPYARLRVKPSSKDKIEEVWVDSELANEAFTYLLSSGKEESVHVEEVLEYNEDPTYLSDLLLYRLTLEAQEKVAESPLSKREIVRRLGTSASQFYRLLDQTNYKKSAGQMLALLHILGCEVDFVVKKRRTRRTA